MQSLITGLLTVLMVLDCILLVFLVLLQLPKKEAGAGLAFGGAATDALFGAGSGNVLTKITKWMATGFFVLAFLLALSSGNPAKPSNMLIEELGKASGTAAAPITAPAGGGALKGVVPASKPLTSEASAAAPVTPVVPPVTTPDTNK